MALLNWNPDGCHWEAKTVLNSKDNPVLRLELQMKPELWEQWMEGTSHLDAGEIHISIGDSLSIFLRQAVSGDEIRLMVARPEAHRWVCTVLLPSSAREFLLQKGAEGFVDFHQLGRLHFLSNLEMVWKRGR